MPSLSPAARRAVVVAVLLASIVVGVLLGVIRTRRRAPVPPPTPVARLRPPPPPGPPPRSDAPPDPSPPRMFRFDPQHTGRSGFRLPRSGTVRAQFRTGARLSSQPVVSLDGALVFGSHDGTLRAWDPHRPASLRAEVPTGGRIYGTPLVMPDNAWISGTDAARIFAIGPRGGLRFALATDGDADTAAVPAPDGAVRIAAHRSLYSLDPDGTVRWRLDLGAKIFSSPAIAPDGTTVFGCQDDAVYAVSPAGAVRWRALTGGDVDATPLVDRDGTVYVGSDDGSFYAILSDGTIRWRTALGGYVRAGAALALDGDLIVATYGPRVRVVRLAAADGKVRWSHEVPGPPSEDYGIASAPLVDRDGCIAVGTPADDVRVLDGDGRLLARFEMPADVDAGPALMADGVLVVGCDDGVIRVVADAWDDAGTPGP